MSSRQVICELQSCGVMGTPVRIVKKQEELTNLRFFHVVDVGLMQRPTKKHQCASHTAQFAVQICQVRATSLATGMKLMQVQQQLEAQQAQHAAQIEDMSSKAAQMESLIRLATELDQQHVTELNAREADLDELRQVNRVCVQPPTCLIGLYKRVVVFGAAHGRCAAATGREPIWQCTAAS